MGRFWEEHRDIKGSEVNRNKEKVIVAGINDGGKDELREDREGGRDQLFSV